MTGGLDRPPRRRLRKYALSQLLQGLSLTSVQIHSILMAHWRDHSSILSLQILLAANQSVEYAQACSMLVRQGGAQQVGRALVEMASILARMDPLPVSAHSLPSGVP